jgi:acyl transferase domain-containing protein
VGPGQTLSTLAQRSLPGYLVLNSLPNARDRSSASASMLTALGRLWLAGCAVTWSHLYKHKRQRLSLPTYPFERERFWIDPTPTDGTASPTRSAQKGAKRPVRDWFYLPAWRQSIAPGPLYAPAEESLTWLFLGEAARIPARLRSALLERGHQVIQVQRGETFARLDEDTYTVNPASMEDYRQLMQTLAEQEKLPDRILHAWLLQPDAARQEKPAQQAEDQEYGYYSLLSLAQALSDLNHRAPIKLYLLTNGMQALAGEELYAGKATALGLCRVIPQELHFLTCHSIDVVLPREDIQEQRMTELLLSELLGNLPEEAIAYRQNQRWVQSFEQLHVSELPDQPVLLRERGVYLLIGGLGAIGLLFAEYLTQTVRADLVLLGRSPFPPEDAWETWPSTHAADDETGRIISRLQAIKRQGSRLRYVQADVSNREQMEKALAEIETTCGPLNGVIYAAGAPSTTLAVSLQELDRAASEQHFQPKLYGPQVLEQVLAGKPLDFCLFQSSLSSLLGGLGFGAYAAANLFLDTYVQAHNRRSSVPWIAVNWDGWQLRQDASEIGISYITAAEGMEAFASLFTGTTSQIIVSALPFNERRAQWMNPGRALQSSEKADGAKHARPQLGTAFVAPRTELEQQIATVWQDFLGIEQISIHDSFFELGGDSLLAIQLASYLYSDLEVNIQVQELLEAPTIASIAELIQRKQAEGDAEEDSEDDLA